VNETSNPPGSLPPRSSNVLPPDSVVGNLTIQALIGEGRFGIVYRALDHATQREVAVEEYMPKELAGRNLQGHVELYSPQYDAAFRAGLQSFVDEARLLAQFDHKALVKVLRVFEAYDTAYVAMPLYEGRTLKELLRESPTMDEPSLKGMLAPLLDALETLHAARCFHCDVCAENILVSEDDGGPILLGFAGPRRVIGCMTPGMAGAVRTGYAPVEQYDSSMQPGPWTDIYALAAVARLAIAGKLPPPSVTRIARDPMRPLTQVATRFGPSFLRAVDYGLAVQPADRPQSIADFRRALGLAIVSMRLPAHALHGATLARPVAPKRMDPLVEAPRALRSAELAAEQDERVTRTGPSPGSTSAATANAVPPPVQASVASSPRRRRAIPVALLTMLLVAVAAYFAMGVRWEPPDDTVAGADQKAVAVPPPGVPQPAPTEPPAAVEPSPPAETTPPVAPQSPPAPEAHAAAVPPLASAAQPAPPPATGLLKLDVKPWGEVLVDGRARGLTPPLKTMQLPEGRHRVEVRNPVGPPLSRDISVTASGRVEISHTFK
jgi:non-specific serine/threonine protein kinase